MGCQDEGSGTETSSVVNARGTACRRHLFFDVRLRNGMNPYLVSVEQVIAYLHVFLKLSLLSACLRKSDVWNGRSSTDRIFARHVHASWYCLRSRWAISRLARC